MLTTCAPPFARARDAERPKTFILFDMKQIGRILAEMLAFKVRGGV